MTGALEAEVSAHKGARNCAVHFCDKACHLGANLSKFELQVVDLRKVSPGIEVGEGRGCQVPTANGSEIHGRSKPLSWICACQGLGVKGDSTASRTEIRVWWAATRAKSRHLNLPNPNADLQNKRRHSETRMRTTRGLFGNNACSRRAARDSAGGLRERQADLQAAASSHLQFVCASFRLSFTGRTPLAFS